MAARDHHMALSIRRATPERRDKDATNGTVAAWNVVWHLQA